MAHTYGYIRVSSKEQNEDRQVLAMSEIGVTGEMLYLDKQSGRDFNRPQYQKVLGTLERDDLLYIKSIDRLGRDYDEIIEQWRLLTKEKEVDIVVLDMPLLNTQKDKDLMGTLISDIVLQILSYVAEKEHENIRQRQAEGIAAAKAKGVHMGRPRKPLPKNFQENYRRWKNGELSCTAAAKRCGMSPRTFKKRGTELPTLPN